LNARSADIQLSILVFSNQFQFELCIFVLLQVETNKVTTRGSLLFFNMTTNDQNETFQHMGSLNKQEEETQIRKKRRSFAKGKFHRVYNKLKQYVQEEELMSVLQELLVDNEKSYTEAENQTDNYMELLDDDKNARKIKELHNDMEVLYREIYDIKSWMSRQKDKFLETRTVPETLVGAHGLKVKKLDAPEFLGNIRDYPSFKRDYERHMMSPTDKIRLR
jgi:hypothetical protein